VACRPVEVQNHEPTTQVGGSKIKFGNWWIFSVCRVTGGQCWYAKGFCGLNPFWQAVIQLAKKLQWLCVTGKFIAAITTACPSSYPGPDESGPHCSHIISYNTAPSAPRSSKRPFLVKCLQ
jgi:hypothetical protein